MARSRDKRAAAGSSKQIPKAEQDDGQEPIVGELVQTNLVSPQTIEMWAESDRNHADFERFLATVGSFTASQMQLNREHATLHPDAVEQRKTQHFRRVQYVVLLCLLPLMIVASVFVPLPVAAFLGIICVLIVSGVLVNGRDREMDLNGFIRMVHSIVGRNRQ